jgi:hypothetical protein
MAVENWNTNDTLNTTLEGVATGEGAMTFPTINDLFRKVCASVRVFYNRTWKITGADKNVTIQASGGAAPAAPQENDLWIEYTP